METAVGRVSELLYGADGEVNGLHLDCGEEVRFPEGQGHLVRLILEAGSRVEIEGIPASNDASGSHIEAALITNCDSKRSMTFLTPTNQGKPGMLADATPDAQASLVLSDGDRQRIPGANEAKKDELAEQNQPHRAPQQNGGDAATAIGLAYDSLHRIQAILAYLHIMKRQVQGMSQFLDEAKRTYEQALSRYESRNFSAATEFAAASRNLSRMVEIIMARTLRSDTTLPSVVPPPPAAAGSSVDSDQVEESLAEAEAVLSRIHWLLENGTLPLEDRSQIRKIASWGLSLHKQAKHMCRNLDLPDAAELSDAALAGAHSAEHLCREWYVGRTSDPLSRAGVRAIAPAIG